LWPAAGSGTGTTGIAAVRRSADGGPPAGRWPRPVAEDKYAVLERRRRLAQIAARHALDRRPAFLREAEPCRSLLVPWRAAASADDARRDVASARATRATLFIPWSSRGHPVYLS
jgi:hypothetical protein